MVWLHPVPSKASQTRTPWRPCASRSPCSSRSSVQAAASSSRGAVVASAGASLGSAAAPFASLGLRTFLGFAAAPFASAVFKHLFGRRRRPQRRAPATMSSGTKAVFSVASFNLRGVMDRWYEREPLLRQCLRDMDADVLCFQEVLTGEFGQDRRLLPAWYHIFPCKAALFNLTRAGGLLRWYAHTTQQLLDFAPLRRFMVSLPAAVEAWRERLVLRADFFRTLRDLAVAPFFGNSVACRIAEAHEIKHSTLVLGDWRAAQRIEFYIGREPPPAVAAAGEGVQAAAALLGEGEHRGRRRCGRRNGGGGDGGGNSDALDSSAAELERAGSGGSEASIGERSVVSGGAGGFKIWVVNTHLDHEHPDNRQRQALAVCEWMDAEKADCAAIILCGDFNGAPGEPFHAALRRRGYVSAHMARHGREPQGTWPTGIQAPLMDKGEFECLDYVYIWTAPDYDVKVLSAEVYGLQPAAHDKTLFPSDHAAIKAKLEVARKLPVDLQAASGAKKEGGGSNGGGGSEAGGSSAEHSSL
ncbi:hypothetical protein ABPG75_000204 [Micractinium tetrahymenae]